MNNSQKIWVVLMLFILVGCGSMGATPIRYYLIDPVEQQALQDKNDLSIQILNLSIPQYLQRFQIATRSGTNQLMFADNHQWGENFQKNLQRTMARNLANLLNTPDIGTPVTRSGSVPEFTLLVYIEQFDQTSRGQVILAGRFQVNDGLSHKVLTTRSFEFEGRRIDRTDYSQMVVSMQSLFSDLCNELAETIVSLDGVK